jgi:GT2 family glycosyltransferase
LTEPELREATLVLTVLNESASLPAFLASLERQESLPAEVVIVDGGSTDDTISVIACWQPPAGCTVTVVQSPGANISTGRNLAIARAARGRILATDAGTSLDPGWAARLLNAFDAPGSPDVVSGFFRPTGGTLLERSIAFTVTPRLAEVDGARFLPSSRSIGFTRDAWASAGGYPEWLDYCEDLVFDLRLKELGLRFAFVPEAWVTWSARSSITAFMTQYYRYARGDGKADLWRKRHAARYGAYGLGVVLAVVAFAQPLALIVLAAGAGGYLAKFWRRLWRGRDEFGAGLTAGLAIVPVIVVAGDLAKMVGYPAGLWWRRRHPQVR